MALENENVNIDDKTDGSGNADKTGSSPWYEGADAETVGYLENRGWNKLTAKEAALNASKAHREAEKLIGAPADQIIRLPKDPNDAAWRGVHSRLGVPADAKEYDFSELKLANGDALFPEFTDFLRTQFHANNVSKTAARNIAAEFVKYVDAQGQTNEAAAAETLANEKDILSKKWGSKYNLNLARAEHAAKQLGLTDESFQALASVEGVGYATVLDLFRNIADKIGEDKFVQNQGGDDMTPNGATAQLEELKRDKEWVKKLNSGDVTARRQFDALIKKISEGNA